MNRPSQRRPRVPAASPARQRGVSAVIAAVLLVSMVSAFALAVDVARLYYAQRELQRLADLAALDAVHIASGCAPQNNGVAGTFAATSDEVTASLARNASAEALAAIGNNVVVEVGSQSVAGGLQNFQVLPAGDAKIQAVRVTLTRSAPTRLLPVITGGNGLAMSARSAAQQPVFASFRIGTTLLTLDTTTASDGLNSLLGSLLGTSVNLNLVGYQGLAGARVSLANLMVAAGVSNVSDLLSLNTTLPQALQIVGDALALGGDATSGAAAGLVTGLAGQSYSSTVPAQNFIGQALNNVGSSLSDPVSSTLASVPFVDGLGLLSALGEAAGKGKTIKLPVTASIAGQELGVFAKVLEPEQVAGPGRAGYDASGQPYTAAKSSQIVLQIRLKTGLSLGILSIADLRLAIDLQGANGTAVLTRIDCPTLTNPVATATIDTTASLLTAKVGTFTGSATAQPPQDPTSGAVITAINIPFVLKLSINTTVGQQSYGTTRTQVGQAPFPDPLTPISSSQNVSAVVGSLLSSNLTINLTVLGLPLPGINAGTLLSTILTTVSGVLDGVLDPLLTGLGIKAGVVGVTVDSITISPPETINRYRN